MLNSQIKAITSDKAQLSVSGVMVEVDNDDIIVNAGGILPTDFLKRVGIDVDTKYGTT